MNDTQMNTNHTVGKHKHNTLQKAGPRTLTAGWTGFRKTQVTVGNFLIVSISAPNTLTHTCEHTHTHTNAQVASIRCLRGGFDPFGKEKLWKQHRKLGEGRKRRCGTPSNTPFSHTKHSSPSSLFSYLLCVVYFPAAPTISNQEAPQTEVSFYGERSW